MDTAPAQHNCSVVGGLLASFRRARACTVGSRRAAASFNRQLMAHRTCAARALHAIFPATDMNIMDPFRRGRRQGQRSFSGVKPLVVQISGFQVSEGADLFPVQIECAA
jgi:hypothetical protein